MNYIVKIIDGKPKIFGTTGKDNGAPVYVFQEEEAFDAALAEGMIPVGALIVKTYDAVEMAGGPFDNALSDKSENAVKNLVIKAEVDRLDQAIADALALRASLTGFGLGKICPVDVTDVTEDTGLVLGAIEKNASQAGTLANQIAIERKRVDVNTNQISKINGKTYNAYVKNAVVLPAGMATDDYLEVCRTDTITESGKYLIYYKMSAMRAVTANLMRFNISRSDLVSDGRYLMLLFGNFGMTIADVVAGTQIILSAQNDTASELTVNATGNNSLTAFLLK